MYETYIDLFNRLGLLKKNRKSFLHHTLSNWMAYTKSKLSTFQTSANWLLFTLTNPPFHNQPNENINPTALLFCEILARNVAICFQKLPPSVHEQPQRQMMAPRHWLLVFHPVLLWKIPLSLVKEDVSDEEVTFCFEKMLWQLFWSDEKKIQVWNFKR